MALPAPAGIWPEHPKPRTADLPHPALVATQPPPGLKGTHLSGDVCPCGPLGRQNLGSRSHSWSEGPNPTSRGPSHPPWQLRPQGGSRATQAPSPLESARLLGNARALRDTLPKHTGVSGDPSLQALLASHLVPRQSESPAPTLHRGEPQLILLTDLSPGLPCPSRAGRNELGPVRLCCSTRIKPGPWAQVQGSMNEALGPFSQTLRTERRGPCARRQRPKSQVRSQPYVGSQACWDQTGLLQGATPSPLQPDQAQLLRPCQAPPRHGLYVAHAGVSYPRPTIPGLTSPLLHAPWLLSLGLPRPGHQSGWPPTAAHQGAAGTSVPPPLALPHSRDD